MATKAKKTTKSTKSKSKAKTSANYANAQAKTASDYAKAQTKTATNAAYDFANFSKNFANPTQFFNLGNLQGFQPANFQAIMEQVIETNQKNWETLTACTQLAVEYAKESMEEQATFANKLIQEAAASVQDSFSTTSSDPREKMEELGEVAQYYLEQTTNQARKTAEENLQVAQAIGEKLKERLTATVEELRSAA